MKRPVGAVAVDAGASSVKTWAGWVEDGLLHTRQIRTQSHQPDGRYWNLDVLDQAVAGAVQAARERFDRASVGVDTWGVDFGVVDAAGRLVLPPVTYRDPSHAEVFNRFGPEFRDWLWAHTGVQHQPFNTLYQLIARRDEDMAVARHRFLLLPDLLLARQGAIKGREITDASTTQLLGLAAGSHTPVWPDPELWALTGWSDAEPAITPGPIVVGETDGVALVRVAGHDTASAVVGLGRLETGDAFLSMGTWSLIGAVCEAPVLTPEARDGRWSNERTPDGRVRLLRNVPGSWVLDRLHAELGVAEPLDAWLRGGHPTTVRFDLLDPSLLAPASMLDACARLVTSPPPTSGEWAFAVRESLVDILAASVSDLGALLGSPVRRIRAVGGGSQLSSVLQRLADRTGLPVQAGPVEATSIGNLGLQLVAQGAVTSADLPDVLERSQRHFGQRAVYSPGGGA